MFGGDEGLQYVDYAVEEFHCVDLLLLILGKRKHHPGGMAFSSVWFDSEQLSYNCEWIDHCHTCYLWNLFH